MTPGGPLSSHLLPPSSDTCLGVMNDLAEGECQKEAELSCYIYARETPFPTLSHSTSDTRVFVADAAKIGREMTSCREQLTV